MDFPPADLTLLLHRMIDGDTDAESQLFEHLYNDLRRIARHLMSAERSTHTLSPTALVHCAYLRIREADFGHLQDRHHFLRIAANVMRRLLIDEARAYKAARRSGALHRVEINDCLLSTESDADTILAVGESIERLREISPERCDVVQLRYFAGHTFADIGAILGISERTAKRHWLLARTFLRGEFDGNAAAAAG